MKSILMLIPKLSKREKAVLFLCVGLIILSVLYNFILEPIAKKWIGFNSEIEIMRLKLKRSAEVVKRQRDIMDQYKSVSSFIKLDNASEEEEMAMLLDELEKLASSSSVRITNIKPRQSRESGYYKKYVVEVESEGNISGFSKFLYGIQNSRQFLDVEKLSLTTKGASSDLLKGQMVVVRILP
ncbi:MAG: hypothetical protein COS99_06670 [Candidatus Omnitrophica bacterium CG07_land_8_20_14_0_80_42_15]|uniref:Type II secretion system protein M n=1 Tax=Candidatus Aquitaenariimonas noxiae TaxID=1974741 RepID=A0A2J0KRI7_9BACT|nr:MAG: hypothetical protein COS99_06670 [Candidatus Omnitrophica bacterium CG07_land_8_20_14_0_80_42_15]